jgi:hypothetical protein
MKFLLPIFLLLASTTLFAEWKIDAPTDKIEGPLKGEIFGVPFTLAKAEWSNNALTLASKDGENGWPESELMIFAERGKKKEWVITPNKDDIDNPHVHMRFAKKGADFNGTMIFMTEYSLRLTVLSETADKVKVAIHVSIPDYKKSYLIGQFEAKIVKD